MLIPAIPPVLIGADTPLVNVPVGAVAVTMTPCTRTVADGW